MIQTVINPYIKLKENLSFHDYEEINNLQKLCFQYDQTTLKLEIDFKLNRAGIKIDRLNNINEFMYYENDKLVGYIGLCYFGGNAIEINGMVHPEYRRRGIFTKLFSLAKEEWEKREYPKILLLCDHNSISGQEFIKNTGAVYCHSEYEMYLRDYPKQESIRNNIVFRKATNQDAIEIARQNAIYFEEDLIEENIIMPEEEEKHGSLIFLAEADGEIIGKVHLEIIDKVGGIYGLGVNPEYRGKGYGKEILTQAIKKLTEKDLQEIMLQVAVKNKTALNIYKSCGFQETSTMDYYEIMNH
ncbi:MAG: GNAT family N-acetyltransferase [Bacillota bacterium]